MVRHAVLAGFVAASFVLACGRARPGGTSPVARRTTTSETGGATEAGSGAAATAEVELPPPASSSAPDAPDWLSDLARIPADPPPKQILLDTHYVVSNEDSPQAYRRVLKDRGGAYVGVGAEQSFLLAGWARSKVLFLIDFDDWVIHVNELHGIVLQKAKTPDEVLELWTRKRRADVEAWVDASVADEAVREKRKKIYREVQDNIHLRLTMIRRWLDEEELPFFGNDQAELDYHAALWREGRVRTIRGDLTVKGAMQGFGDLARRAGWPVRVLYLSNAEQYFSFENNAFRDNIRSLPFDDQSVVLHTLVIGKPNKFRYVWQKGPEYSQWVGDVASFGKMIQEVEFATRGELVDGAYLLNRKKP